MVNPTITIPKSSPFFLWYVDPGHGSCFYWVNPTIEIPMQHYPSSKKIAKRPLHACEVIFIDEQWLNHHQDLVDIGSHLKSQELAKGMKVGREFWTSWNSSDLIRTARFRVEIPKKHWRHRANFFKNRCFDPNLDHNPKQQQLVCPCTLSKCPRGSFWDTSHHFSAIYAFLSWKTIIVAHTTDKMTATSPQPCSAREKPNVSCSVNPRESSHVCWFRFFSHFLQ